MEKENTQQERAAAAALAEALGNLPLALEQAAAYATRAGLSLADYLGLFRASRPEVEARATGSEEYPPALATTFDISFTRLQTESPAAAELLTLCAFLAPDEVPLEILKDGAGHLPPALAAAAADPEALAALAATLQTYALAKVRGGSFLTLHHFVQAAARDRLSEDDRKTWAGTAVHLMNAAFPYEDDDPQTWEESSRLLQHALRAAAHARELHVSERATADLLNLVGLYLLNKAELVESKAALEQALELNKATSVSKNHRVAVCLNNLGRVLQEQGHLKESQSYLEQALAINEDVFGPDDPEVAINLNNLGEVLRLQGDLENAKERLGRALAIDEASLSPDNPRIAIRLNNLGAVLQALGNLDEARSSYERALAIDEAAYGRDHPNIGIRLNNLGTIFQKKGDLDGARANFERALQILRVMLGEKHPWTLVVKENLRQVVFRNEDARGT